MEKFIEFSKWTFTTERCQRDHGDKLKYFITTTRNSTSGVNCVNNFAECTTAGCKFKTDECVRSQDANIVACFDGLNDGQKCVEDISEHSANFEIIKIGPGDCDTTLPTEKSDSSIYAHSQKVAIPVDDWKPLRVKI